MMIPQSRTGVRAFMVLLLALGALVMSAPSGAVDEDRMKEKGSWQDLVFLYTTDIKGKIEPCG